MNKYIKLFEYIRINNKDDYKLTFEEINKIIDFELDHSFLKYKKDLLSYGYEVIKIFKKEKYVLIKKK